MSFDFNAHLGTVTRSVSSLERNGEPAHKVSLERTYNTSAEDLWDACTRPERLRRWFLPVAGELKPGGHYQLEGNAGGTITECKPPRFLAVTWEFGGGMSWLELHIRTEENDRSKLILAHICPLDEHWQTYGPGATGVGWDLGLAGLAAYLGPDSFERFDEAAFFASPEGQAFMTGSSADWGRAAIAAGDDPTQAKAAASRTAAFYTGTEAEED